MRVELHLAEYRATISAALPPVTRNQCRLAKRPISPKGDAEYSRDVSGSCSSASGGDGFFSVETTPK